MFLPAHPDEHFANCSLTDPKPSRDFAMGMPLSFEPVHRLPPGISPSCASRRIAAWLAKRSQSTLLISTLIATQCSGRITEDASHIVLIGPALFDEIYHRLCLGHSVGHCVMSHGDARHNHHSMALLRPDLATVVDRAHFRRIAGVGKQVLNFGGHRVPPNTAVLKKRTVLGSRSKMSLQATKPN